MTKINIGSIVECINDEFIDLTTNPFKKDKIDLPKNGVEYTIREIYTNKYGTGVKLNEIINPEYFFNAKIGFIEPYFGIHRFRKKIINCNN